MNETRPTTAAMQETIRRSREIARIGLRKMAKQRAVICATVRDCADGLRQNIPAMNRLIKMFRSAAVVVVENDSIDATKYLLQDWSGSQEGVSVISRDTGINTIQRNSDGINPWFSQHRISLMAKYRNQYLEHICSDRPEPDYLVIVDLDVARISLDGIAHGFGLDIQWDCLCANGIKRGDSGWIYYDTYAYQEYGDNGPQNTRQLIVNQRRLARMSAGGNPLRVNSAFGGMALYTYAAIKSSRYGCLENDDPVITAHSEHIALHRQMARHGFDKIYINPAQVVVY